MTIAKFRETDGSEGGDQVIALTISISATKFWGTELGTSKMLKAARGASGATPDKRDTIFDLLSHNPKVGRSNRPPATSHTPNSQGVAPLG